MQHSSELTEDELVLIQEHADQARQSFAGLKKARPKTTAPMASTPKSGTAPPETAAIPPGTPDNKLAVEFSKAFSAWMKAVRGCPSSKSSTWLRLPEYANLKKLGTGIVPLLTDRLAKGEVPASRALFDIDKVKLQDKVKTSTLSDFRAVILKIEVVHIVETRKLLAAFAERKDELKPRTHDEV
ncbi:hypothetical protein GQ53DRAFT_93335 [Thozetella sp. PMI_491]|nr:hypothetical protein GQ53DRAFT_93335 [Thozetella sp. PMI_491]